MYFYYIFLNNKKSSFFFGFIFSKLYFPGFIVFLIGNIGLGKTTFTKGFLKNFLYKNNIKSPTYSLVNCYEYSRNLTIYHFDFYRIFSFKELINIDFDDYINNNFIFIIEWGESILSKKINPHITVNFYHYNNFNFRFLIFKSNFFNFFYLLG